MTPPNSLLLAGNPDLPQPILDDLCADLHASGWTVTGVQAMDELAVRFAETWRRLTGRPYHMHLHMRAYAVDRVIPPARPASGSLRLATPADLDLLVPWRAAFEAESLNEQPPENLRELLTREIEEGKLYVWIDGVPVSTAACTRPTRRGIWIYAVYTPPEYRGRGYASTCVAELSQQWLDSGKSLVNLYTVIDYPTSNHIYQQIGYRPVRDFSVLQFY